MCKKQSKNVLILNILQILERCSDIKHPLTQNDIIKLLKEEYDMDVERKSITRNIDNLIEAGYDIGHEESTKGKGKNLKVVRTNFYYEHNLTLFKRMDSMKRVMILLKEIVYTIVVVLYLFIVGCSHSVAVQNVSNADYSLYDEIIKNIDKEPYDEIFWLNPEETVGMIVYNDTKLKDIDGDGVDELFVLRRYIKPITNQFGISNGYYSSLENFNSLAIQHSLISESYRIVNNKVEELFIGNEPVSTHAFDGGHFGIYYFLLDDGRIAMFNRSYWDEILKLYSNLNLETTILHIGDMETNEWEWKINGKKAKQTKVAKILKEISFISS